MMKTFIFENYDFYESNNTASFVYSFDHDRFFKEEIRFGKKDSSYNKEILNKTLFLAFILIGVSYYKLFPKSAIKWNYGEIDAWQSAFLNKVYQEGLGQFAFENNLTRNDLAYFTKTKDSVEGGVGYDQEGNVSLQSGGKDSLLTAQLLDEKGINFSSFYISYNYEQKYPNILDEVGEKLVVIHRKVDIDGIKEALNIGGLNGHVPVTYIVQAISLVQAILLGKNKLFVSIGHEGEEAHAWIGDLSVNHQWSKTWEAEILFSEYVSRYISPDLKIGSPLRKYSELRVAELFSEKAWKKYGHRFSSCNIANYKHGKDNTKLEWCGNCSKCANSYLLFAPFIDKDDLDSVMGDLFKKDSLRDTFKGLLGIDNSMKPFECVGEVEELRLAYHKALERGYSKLDFEVPVSSFNYMETYPCQKSFDLDL